MKFKWLMTNTKEYDEIFIKIEITDVEMQKAILEYLYALAKIGVEKLS